MRSVESKTALLLGLALLLFSGCSDEGEDLFAPAAVDDLTVTAADNVSVTLAWTATGDDGESGTADSYDLRLYEGTLVDSLWPYAIPVANLPTPKKAGEPESYVVGHLEAGKTYSFALTVRDETGNLSDLSNIVTTETIPQSGTDTNWWDGFLYEGLDGPVYCLAPYDGKLIAGGGFLEAGHTFVYRIASWDGLTFSPLGSGMNGEVRALVDFNGNLIAGGSFTGAGENPASFIAMWQGEKWFPISQGMNNSVLALTVFQGELIAGGLFTEADDAAANYIARWTGSSWQAIPGLDGPVYALTVHNDELIAGGRFSHADGLEVRQIARWNGSAWSPLDSGLFVSPPLPSVSALGQVDGVLYVGGYFSHAGDVPTPNIARWTAAGWGGLGYGTDEEVRAVASYDGLVVGGRFATAGETPARGIARWDGSLWRALGSGVSGGNGYVYAMTEFEGSLFVGGSFDSAGGKVSSNIARWDD